MVMENKSPCVFKMILLGDSGVGKTCLLRRFVDDDFNCCMTSTIGIDFQCRKVELDGKQVKLQIWDTGGHERYRAIPIAYCRGVMGVILIYDITNKTSFENIESWMRQIDNNASRDVGKIIIGAKCDFNETRTISEEMGEQLARRFNVSFFETSAKTGINVEEAFLNIARTIKSRVDAGAFGIDNASQEGVVSLAHDQSREKKDKKPCCGS